MFTSKGKQAHILFLHYSIGSELRLVCKEGRPWRRRCGGGGDAAAATLALTVLAAAAAMEAKAKARERGREAAAAALLGTTKSIESRRDFPHFISAWPPSASTKPMDNGQR